MSAHTAIASQTLTSSAASVTFSSIPQDFRDLVLVGRFDSAGANTLARFNGSTSSIYNHVLMYAAPSVGSFTQSSVDKFVLDFGANMVIMQIMDYSQTNKHKSFISRSDFPTTATCATAGRFANTAAVTSLEVFVSGNFAAGATFNLFGVSA